MRTKLLLATVLVTAAFSAQAANTIRFQGEVATQTCTVAVNDSATPTVLLPTVPVSALATSGDTAGETPFTVKLTNCTVAATDTAIGTVFLANNLTSKNRIGNTGTATNVSLELTGGVGSSTVLNMNGASSNAGLVLKSGDTEASHDFAVRYHAEGASSAGTVKGSVQYAVTYL